MPILSGQEKYELRKKIRMTDIMRGIYSEWAWNQDKGRGVVTQEVFDEKTRLVYCYNYNKYSFFLKDRIRLYAVIINEQPIGIACIASVYNRAYSVCKFIPNKKYESWDGNRLCEILNQAMEGTTLRYSCLSVEEQKSWMQEYGQALFKEHLKFDDDFIAGLWRSMNTPLGKQQLLEYREMLYAKYAAFTIAQKEKIAKEIVFYIVPQYISGQDDEENALIRDLCRFVIKEYEISVGSEWDLEQILPKLKERFLINSLEKAKEYYIANECSIERYKDCCMDVDYEEIMDSFAQWDISAYESQWIQEALERCFWAEGIYKDWNVERILDFITRMDVEVDTLHKVKKYIREHIDEIYVREVPMCHINEMLSNNTYGNEARELLEECCDMLQGFESRALTMDEKENLRKAQNSIELPYAKFDFINKKEKVIVIQDTTRIRTPRDPQEPRYEWYPKEEDPRTFLFWGEEELIGKMEVAEHHIVWNVIGEDKKRLFKLFSNHVRNLEIIPPEKAVRYATKEEAAHYEKETIDSCIANDNFFGLHSEWFECTGQPLNARLMPTIVGKLKAFEKGGGKPGIVGMNLLGYILPNIKDNPKLCSQEDLDCIGEYLKNTSIKFIGEEVVATENTPDVLMSTYQPLYLQNTLDDMEQMYKFFYCKKSKYRRGSVYYYNTDFNEKVWNAFNNFDIEKYEKQWVQEEFDIEISDIADPCYALDLLEKVGTFENYTKFIEKSETCKKKEYVYFRLKKMCQSISDKRTRSLVKKFCERLFLEINGKREDAEESEHENDVPKWKILLFVGVICVVVIAVANLLDIRLRSAKYLVYAIVCLGLFFVSVVFNGNLPRK